MWSPNWAPDAQHQDALQVGAFQPFSALDWPDHLAAVVFTQGCPLSCSYCHNPHLMESSPGAIGFGRVLGEIGRRVDLLDGVVFSGGEPCAQSGLPGAMEAVRALGLKVALHTSGAFPMMLQRVLPKVDWVGLDVKAPQQSFERVTGAPAWRRTEQSLDLLVGSGKDFEARTTWSPDLFPADELLAMARALADRGVAHYALQRMRRLTLDHAPRWMPDPAPPPYLVTQLGNIFRHFIVR